MGRSIVMLAAAVSLLAGACGDTQPAATPPPASSIAAPAPTTTVAPPPAESLPVSTMPVAAASDLGAFCQATASVSSILLLSAVNDLAGEGSQELYLLAKIPELVAASAAMARTAPPEFAEQAKTVADLYSTVSDLADARGLSAADLERLAGDIDDGAATIDELFAELGITVAEISQLFEDASVRLADREPPTDLIGADIADLGCPSAEVAGGVCDLLGPADLGPLIGDDYTTEVEVIEGIGEQCRFRSGDLAFVEVVHAGPVFYLPGAWNEVEFIDGVGDEAFLTTGLDTPFLYAKQGDTVISVLVANMKPAVTHDQLAALAITALANATR